MQVALIKVFVHGLFGELIMSMMHILRLMFSTDRVNMRTLSSEVAGVFLRKAHGAGRGVWGVGRAVDRGRGGAYPGLHHLALPLSRRVIRNGEKAKLANRWARQPGIQNKTVCPWQKEQFF